LHGPGGEYQGSYNRSQLQAWAKRLREWMQRLSAAYIYFDNDQAGYALQNAWALKDILSSTSLA
jgi:uncharacterized protein YecE (DUF72 family)